MYAAWLRNSVRPALSDCGFYWRGAGETARRYIAQIRKPSSRPAFIVAIILQLFCGPQTCRLREIPKAACGSRDLHKGKRAPLHS